MITSNEDDATSGGIVNSAFKSIDLSHQKPRESEAEVRKSRRKLEAETGQAVLMLSEKVHQLVLFIKKQLQFTTHPLRGVIEKFKSAFVKKNYVLLCRQSADTDTPEPLSDIPFDSKIAYVQHSVKKMIGVLVDATLMFYELDEIIKPASLSKELFTNLITNYVLEGELYFLVYNITSCWL